MTQRILIYYIGVIGVPGKGPNLIQDYDPNKTIGEIIQTMKKYGFSESNRRAEFLKFKPGKLPDYDKNNPFWSHETKLSEYESYYGSPRDIWMIYCLTSCLI